MNSYAEALALLDALPLAPQVAELPLDQALGRTLAADVAFRGDQPPIDRATMDGFAVNLGTPSPSSARSQAEPGLGAPGDFFTILGAVHAGETYRGDVAPGQAVRIMTGAPTPDGCTVVPVEITAVDGDRLRVTDGAALAPGRNIARRGEDAPAGHVVLTAGSVLSPTALAVAAMAGHATVPVFQPPAIRVIATGDELGVADAGTPDSRIADSNGPFLHAFATALGCPVVRLRCGDDLAQLTAALAGGGRVVVTTGGVSAGDRDLVPQAATAAGFARVFHHVAIQPGKPVLVARHDDGRVLIGLPGNPVSVLACAHLFLLPVLNRLLGRPAQGWIRLPIAQAQRGAKRHRFLPAKVVGAADHTVAIEPLDWNGSGDLVAAAAGAFLVSIPAGSQLAAGDLVDVLPYVGGPGGGVLPARSRSR